ncbi:MAG: hypothetical protein V4553_12365 [Bacteroidota bacterium]
MPAANRRFAFAGMACPAAKSGRMYMLGIEHRGMYEHTRPETLQITPTSSNKMVAPICHHILIFLTRAAIAVNVPMSSQ